MLQTDKQKEIYHKHILKQNCVTLSIAYICIDADRFNDTRCLWSLPDAQLVKCWADLPSMQALQEHHSVADLPQHTLFPAWIPDSEHTPGTQSKSRQSEILNCP